MINQNSLPSSIVEAKSTNEFKKLFDNLNDDIIGSGFKDFALFFILLHYDYNYKWISIHTVSSSILG